MRTRVYQLRREFRARVSESVAETCYDGYLIRFGSGELDFWVFEGRVAAGEEADRRGDLPGAVARFRVARSRSGRRAAGEPLTAWTTRMTATRPRVAERCVELSLRLGHHRGPVDELVTLTTEHPLHEGFHVQRIGVSGGAPLTSRAVLRVGSGALQGVSRWEKRPVPGSLEV